MNAIRIRKHIDSETLHLPELRAMMGKTVDIIVLDETSAAHAEESLETMETFLDDALHRPPPTPEELEELRELAENDPALAAILEIYESGGLNAEAVVELRARG